MSKDSKTPPMVPSLVVGLLREKIRQRDAHIAVLEAKKVGLAVENEQLRAFRVWDYGYTREFAVAGAWVSSGLIFLSLADNPGDGNHVHIAYQLNNWSDPSSPSFD